MRLLKIIAIYTLILLFACRKEKKLIEDSSAKLEFSTDSILFDTVFTTVGSTTKLFLIYNNHNRPIKVSSIKLKNGLASNFRLNVDGIAGHSFSDIIIPKKDSLWVFVEVTVDPNNVNSPVVIYDAVEFITNGNSQQVVLEAWGQDAYYHKPTEFPLNGFPPYSYITGANTWTNDKPHVIYGYFVVDSAATLTMMPGTRVYMHNNSVLWVYKDGTLKIKGNSSTPVKIQGDRLEPDYNELSGQWGAIWLSALSKDNEIDWAVIKNGDYGLIVDTFATSPNPTLLMDHTIIKNMATVGLWGRGSIIRASNTLIANCGERCVSMLFGGGYSFWHCTFANYFNQNMNKQRSTPLLQFNNYLIADNVLYPRPLDSCYFSNCIVYGDLDNELEFDSTAFANFAFKFDHCVLKTDKSTSQTYHYQNVLVNQDPVFFDGPNGNYNIKGNSSANGTGSQSTAIKYPVDLNSKFRDTATPDIGCYEAQ